MLKDPKTKKMQEHHPRFDKILDINAKRMDSVLQSIHAFAWDIDNNFNFTYISPHITEILGYQPQEIIGQSFASILENKNIETLVQHFSNRPNNEKPFKDISLQLKTPDQRLVWLRISGLPLLDKNETLIGYSGCATDMSIDKLEEVSLEQTFEEANFAADARSSFLAMMSHEIRNPLNGIIGLSGVLKDTQLNQEQFDYIIRIEKSGQHLLQLINDVLDYSKLDSGEFDLENNIFQIEEQVNLSIDIANTNIDKKPILTETHIHKAVPKYLKGDAGRLRQVLVNLIGNAVKFTHQGKITITVSYVEEDDKNITLKFSIQDTGIGIPQSEIKTLFDKFTQVTRKGETRNPGTGLGLAICREIVTIMGGDIGVESTENKGSDFWFTIPFEKAQPNEADQEYTRKNPEKSFQNKSGQPMRILVADDSINNQILIKKLLEKRNHNVNVVGNGAEAVTAVENIPYDMVFMDIQMPEMDGVTATTKIRSEKNKDRENLPIIALTADIIPGARERYIEAGMNDYLQKPINTDVLDQILNKWSVQKLQEYPKTQQEEFLIDQKIIQNLQNEMTNNELIKVYDSLWENIKDDIENLKQATEKQQINNIRSLAHKIKGTAGNFGLSYLSNCAYDIERNASDALIAQKKLSELSKILFKSQQEIIKIL